MSQHTHFTQTLFAAQSAQDVAGTLQRDMIGNVRELTVYAVSSAGVSAGVVTVEGAHDPDYTGTWASLGTITCNAASKVNGIVQITGAHRAVRARISTAITGGTVSCYAVGN